MSQIRIENLRKEYIERRRRPRKGEPHEKGACDFCGVHVVLDGVNLEFEEGEMVCILGPSGCGKSTMLKIMAGFDKPSSGRVLINDEEVRGPSSDYIFVFQQSGLLPWMTAWENIELGVRHLEEAEKNERIQEHIDLVELSGSENLYPFQLSGGMQRRAELARALAVNPDILIMDEPFTGLDFLTHMKMREELVNMHEYLGKTMIMVTHFIDDALVMGDRLVLMGGSPANVKLERKLDMPHPRNVEKNPELSELRDELFFKLGVSYVA